MSLHIRGRFYTVSKIALTNGSVQLLLNHRLFLKSVIGQISLCTPKQKQKERKKVIINQSRVVRFSVLEKYLLNVVNAATQTHTRTHTHAYEFLKTKTH